MNVIGVTEGDVLTRTLRMEPTVRDGLAVADSSRDLAKIVVLERHHATGRFTIEAKNTQIDYLQANIRQKSAASVICMALITELPHIN